MNEYYKINLIFYHYLNISDVSAAHSIDVDDEYIYVAQGGGLLILKISTTPDTGATGSYILEILPYIIIIIIIIISVVIAVGGISIVLYFKIYRKKKKKI